MPVLILFEAGLALGDVNALWYNGRTPRVAPESASLSEISPGVYSLTAAPNATLDVLRVTWFYGGSWGEASFPSSPRRPPEEVLIPVRDPGLIAADFGLVLVKDGVVDTETTLVCDELADGGGYAVYGWANGESISLHELVWSYAGFSHAVSWRDSRTQISAQTPETVARELLNTYISNVFVGEDGLSRDYCPFIGAGIYLDLEDVAAADLVLSPFDTAETINEVGLVKLELMPGILVEQANIGDGRPVSTSVSAVFYVHSPIQKDLRLIELYTEVLISALWCLTLRKIQDPDVMFRHLGDSIEVGEIFQEGCFLVRPLTALFERTTPRPYVGLQEVPVP